MASSHPTHPIKYLPSILFILLSLCSAHAQKANAPYAEAALTSTHLVPGEQCHLIVRMRGGEPDGRPAPPEVPNTAVNFVRSITHINSNRKLSTAFLYRVTPAKAGALTIPPIPLKSRGITYHTAPLHVTVHPLSKLIPLPSGIKNHNILVGWFPEKNTLYQGEQCPVTLKIYIPQQLPVATQGWGLPDAAKNNCLAWRFSLPQTNETSQVTIDGTSYASSIFKTTLSGIEPGTATFGPAPLRIIIRQSIIDPLRGSRLVNTPIEFTVPATSFQILKLPKGTPQHFNGAVGQFDIQAFCEQTTLNENEPTELFLRISGRGNLETIRPPVLSDDSWKIIDSSKITRGKERRNIQGAVTFRQLLRPQRLKNTALPTTIPAYTLSYFNPKDKSYHTLTTAPIPVQITPATNTNQTPAHHLTTTTEKLGTSPEEMRNILGFINRPHTISTTTRIHPHLWQIAPALIGLFLISIPLRKKIKAATTKHPDAIRKQEALTDLNQETDLRNFYRKAGHFIEQWLTRDRASQTSMEADIQTIITERDNLCFQSDHASSHPSPPIPPDRKKTIITLLKRSSKITLFILIILFQTTDITIAGDAPSLARDAWKSGNYQQAIEHYQQAYPDPLDTPADILFNIGNCHHRLNHPGLAALTWRQALNIEPSHQQARQNLRYLELKQTAIIPSYTDWQLALTHTSPRTYQTIFHASLWLFALTLLSLIIFRPRGIKTTLCVILLVITPVTACLGAMATHWYPDDHLFASPEKQAIVLKNTLLYREAHRQDASPRSLPAASLLRINAVRGPWTHITTSDEQSGWVLSKQLKRIHP